MCYLAPYFISRISKPFFADLMVGFPSKFQWYYWVATVGFPLKNPGSVVFQREQVHSKLGCRGYGSQFDVLSSWKYRWIGHHRSFFSSLLQSFGDTADPQYGFAPRSWLQVAMSEDLIDLSGPQSSQSRFGPVLKGGIRGTWWSEIRFEICKSPQKHGRHWKYLEIFFLGLAIIALVDQKSTLVGTWIVDDCCLLTNKSHNWAMVLSHPGEWWLWP